MNTREARMINEIIKDSIKGIASMNDIDLKEKHGELMIHKDDFPRLEKEIDKFLGKHKIS